jgi:glutaredoxin
MFSKETCPFCMRAKDLLDDLDVPYKAYELQFDSK